VSAGELRYRLRCIDKLGHAFRGDESLLDVGCGDGGVARLLRARVREVVAVDVEESAAWSDEPGLRFQIADGEKLPFEAASFDAVHSKDSLHHMEHPDRALAEYARVLQPGGFALIVEANRYNPSFYLQMTLVRRHQHFTRDRFRMLVHDVFPDARMGAFEAHYVPRVRGLLLRFQHDVEETLERVSALRPVLSYNFAVAAMSSRRTGRRWSSRRGRAPRSSPAGSR
jgi:ubiquinone/menaquinone biosynthesis C-methylase UbiE